MTRAIKLQTRITTLVLKAYMMLTISNLIICMTKAPHVVKRKEGENDDERLAKILKEIANTVQDTGRYCDGGGYS